MFKFALLIMFFMFCAFCFVLGAKIRTWEPGPAEPTAIPTVTDAINCLRGNTPPPEPEPDMKKRFFVRRWWRTMKGYRGEEAIAPVRFWRKNVINHRDSDMIEHGWPEERD